MNGNFKIQQDLLNRVEKLIGSKINVYSLVRGGYTPAIRLLCETKNLTYFVKIGTTPLTSKFLRREYHVYSQVMGDFMPKLEAWEDHEVTPILIIEDLSKNHWPPPWDDRGVDLVLSQIDAMHKKTGVQLEKYTQINSIQNSNWKIVSGDPKPFLSLNLVDGLWLDSAIPILVEYEEKCEMDGESFCHWDLRSDNICIAKNRSIFVDWNLACLSNPKLDLGFWLPSLKFEGGPAPEDILPNSPEIAAWVSGFFAARAGLPGIIDAPGVRLVQKQQLEVALPWVIRELALPFPKK